MTELLKDDDFDVPPLRCLNQPGTAKTNRRILRYRTSLTGAPSGSALTPGCSYCPWSPLMKVPLPTTLVTRPRSRSSLIARRTVR
jgi:hypothetical protein